MTFPAPPLGMESAALLSNDDFLPAAQVEVRWGADKNENQALLLALFALAATGLSVDRTS